MYGWVSILNLGCFLFFRWQCTSAQAKWRTRRLSSTTPSAFLSTRTSRRPSDATLTSLCTGCWLPPSVRTAFSLYKEPVVDTHTHTEVKNRQCCLLPTMTRLCCRTQLVCNVGKKSRKEQSSLRPGVDVLSAPFPLLLFLHSRLLAPTMCVKNRCELFMRCGSCSLCSCLSTGCLHTECGPHLGLSTSQVQKQAMHCNDKKTVSKRVQELSSDLFFGVFVKVSD